MDEKNAGVTPTDEKIEPHVSVTDIVRGYKRAPETVLQLIRDGESRPSGLTRFGLTYIVK